MEQLQRQQRAGDGSRDGINCCGCEWGSDGVVSIGVHGWVVCSRGVVIISGHRVSISFCSALVVVVIAAVVAHSVLLRIGGIVGVGVGSWGCGGIFGIYDFDVSIFIFVGVFDAAALAAFGGNGGGGGGGLLWSTASHGEWGGVQRAVAAVGVAAGGIGWVPKVFWRLTR